MTPTEHWLAMRHAILNVQGHNREADMRYAFLSGMAARENDLAAARERIAELEAAVLTLEKASSPFGTRMEQAVTHLQKWRDEHPGQMPPLLDSESVPMHWTYTPSVGEARRLIAALEQARAALAGSQGGGDLPQAERQCIACKRRWFVPAQSVSVLGAYWYCELCAGSQGGGGGEFTAAEREAIISGSLTVPRATVERAMAQAATNAETTAPECRDGWHAIRPGEGACVCGENRMELML